MLYFFLYITDSILNELKEALNSIKNDRLNAERENKERLKMEINEIRALKTEISEASTRSIMEIADLRQQLNLTSSERELVEAEERKSRRKADRENAAQLELTVSTALKKVEELKVLYENERSRNEEREVTRIAQWEKDRKARMDMLQSDRLFKMEEESKATLEARELAKAKRAKIDEQNKLVTLSLRNELNAIEKAQSEAKVYDGKLRLEKESEDRKRQNLYEKLKGVESRVLDPSSTNPLSPRGSNNSRVSEELFIYIYIYMYIFISNISYFF